MYSLVGTDGTRYFTFELKPGSYLVGRKVDCDFPVPNQTVSRQHARIDVDSSGEQIHLTDLGSRNGTMVNSRRVVDRVQLQPGDQIELGSTQFRLTAEGDTSSGLGRPITTKLADQEPEKSVFLSLNEAQKPLPSHVSQRPELFPTLSEMARLLVHTEPRSTMLERSLELVARMIPADRLAVLTTPEDESDVITAASLSPGNKDLGSFTLSRTIVQKIMEEKTSILIGDPSQDDRFAQQESIIMSDMKSAMAVPLFDSGEVLGILYADTTNPLHQYNDEYLRLLAVFGNIIAARLLNYQLIATSMICNSCPTAGFSFSWPMSAARDWGPLSSCHRSSDRFVSCASSSRSAFWKSWRKYPTSCFISAIRKTSLHSSRP
jgi:adenylate cyclase